MIVCQAMNTYMKLSIFYYFYFCSKFFFLPILKIMNLVDATYVWRIMKKGTKYECFLASTSITCHVSIHGLKKYMGIVIFYHSFCIYQFSFYK